MKTILTVWERRGYDVWGNRKDGYDVNDTFRESEVELRLKVKLYNENTPRVFETAYPTDYQLRKVFGVSCRLDVQGDDIHVYVNRASDGYPIGELICISHKSLSPIRKYE